MIVNSEILSHAKSEYPKEVCGVIIIFKGRERYIPCRNIAIDACNQFEIHPEDYASAEDLGIITKIVHSHPKTNASPSQFDLVGIEKSGLPWVIINPLTEQITETHPSGFKAPLIGREFGYGVFDCFSIVQDYYEQELNIHIERHPSENGWWNKGRNIIKENIEVAGFNKVSTPEVHDIILMYNGASVPNHLAVYVGNNLMLHQSQNRLSSRDIYGGYWAKNTEGFYRHIDRIK